MTPSADHLDRIGAPPEALQFFSLIRPAVLVKTTAAPNTDCTVPHESSRDKSFSEVTANKKAAELP
jgi:hypothetical protein